MEKSRYTRLLNNSFLFAIGNLGSKLITFFMIPILTAKLTTQEYGAVDLVMITVSLLLPVISLSIYEAVLRFGMDSNYDKNKILTNALVLVFYSNLFLLLILPFLIWAKINFGVLIILILFSQNFQTLFSQYAKAANEISIFAKNGIYLTLLTAAFTCLSLFMLNQTTEGYLWSVFLATMFSNFWLVWKLKLLSQIKFELFDIAFLRKMAHYSIPLIPNSIALWINNVANRYFILFFIGSAANGIYAIANKIPTLIGIINTIFFQAWQMSVIEEYQKKDRDAFYSKTFAYYSRFLSVGVSILLILLRPMMNMIVSPAFASSWQYVPLLLLSVMYASFSGFFGQYYIASKETEKVFGTTVIGAVLNVLLNIIFIPTFSLNGTGISSVISFFVLWILRVKDTQRLIKTKLDLRYFVMSHCLLFLQIFFLYYFMDEQKLAIAFQLPLVGGMLLSNTRVIVDMVKTRQHS